MPIGARALRSRLRYGLQVRTSDGERTYDAGETYYWPPGHNLEARTDAVYLEFSPSDQYDELMAHCARVMDSM